MRKLHAVALLIAEALLAVGCAPMQETPTMEAPTEAPTMAVQPTEAPTMVVEPTQPEPTEPSPEETEEATGNEAQVVMQNTAFEPQEITVSPGTTVVWTNEDAVAHTVTAGTRGEPSGMFDANVDGGESFSFTFEEPGTYEYYCSIHPGMDGTVIVTEGDGEAEMEDEQQMTEDDEEEMEGSAEFAPVVALEQVAMNLAAPVALAAPDDGSGRLFVVDQVGIIYIVSPDGTMADEPFLDLQDRIIALDEGYDERGLLGLALHPNYADNGRFFVYYSAPLRDGAPAGWDHTSHLSEFTVSEADPNVADADSERLLLQVDQPQSNHNAGAIAFGSDGYLYVPLGDGGDADDTGTGHVSDWYEENEGGNGQDVSENLLGSILRIDVDGMGDKPYAIPEDNPEISGDYPEIWAYGFRNPYRMAFDPSGDHELFVGDAGQELWEEVSIVEAGGNYGWNVKEGSHCFNAANPENARSDCPDQDPEGDPLIDPVIEFANAKQADGLGLVVIGGNVYRGDAMPAWDGRYIFGQWSTSFQNPRGSLFVATRPEDDGLWDFEPIEVADREGGQLNAYLLSFGQDTEGEVYVLTSNTAGPSGTTGQVFRITPPEGE